MGKFAWRRTLRKWGKKKREHPKRWKLNYAKPPGEQTAAWLVLLILRSTKILRYDFRRER
jgi:hypothetical protein